ncbi:hypothetical protein GGX14DRAFT_394623 [Mycena pura]|uniref:Uncharacterized protein n=1 Tax=Mycena pura TaxID=153505 RepID=A0AAD6YFD7_9AGAR|nr:hypothetical protein GGX14DRAFT_394623 [Mycena pura]
MPTGHWHSCVTVDLQDTSKASQTCGQTSDSVMLVMRPLCSDGSVSSTGALARAGLHERKPQLRWMGRMRFGILGSGQPLTIEMEGVQKCFNTRQLLELGVGHQIAEARRPGPRGSFSSAPQFFGPGAHIAQAEITRGERCQCPHKTSFDWRCATLYLCWWVSHGRASCKEAVQRKDCDSAATGVRPPVVIFTMFVLRALRPALTSAPNRGALRFGVARKVAGKKEDIVEDEKATVH